MQLQASTNSDHHFLKLHFHWQTDKIVLINFQPFCANAVPISSRFCVRVDISSSPTARSLPDNSLEELTLAVTLTGEQVGVEHAVC